MIRVAATFSVYFCSGPASFWSISKYENESYAGNLWPFSACVSKKLQIQSRPAFQDIVRRPCAKTAFYKELKDLDLRTKGWCVRASSMWCNDDQYLTLKGVKYAHCASFTFVPDFHLTCNKELLMSSLGKEHTEIETQENCWRPWQYDIMTLHLKEWSTSFRLLHRGLWFPSDMQGCTIDLQGDGVKIKPLPYPVETDI